MYKTISSTPQVTGQSLIWPLASTCQSVCVTYWIPILLRYHECTWVVMSLRDGRTFKKWKWKQLIKQSGLNHSTAVWAPWFTYTTKSFPTVINQQTCCHKFASFTINQHDHNLIKLRVLVAHSKSVCVAFHIQTPVCGSLWRLWNKRLRGVLSIQL